MVQRNRNEGGGLKGGSAKHAPLAAAPADKRAHWSAEDVSSLHAGLRKYGRKYGLIAKEIEGKNLDKSKHTVKSMLQK
jgi:hypothetical protein